MNEENKEAFKNLGGEIALKAALNEFYTLGIIFSVMSVGKKILVNYFRHIYCLPFHKKTSL